MAVVSDVAFEGAVSLSIFSFGTVISRKTYSASSAGRATGDAKAPILITAIASNDELRNFMVAAYNLAKCSKPTRKKGNTEMHSIR